MIYIIIGIIILLIILIIYFYLEAHLLKKTRYEINTDKIDKEFKIIQLSDYHNQKNKWLLKQIVDTIKEEKPDIIVISGDLIDIDDNKYVEYLIKDIYKLAPIYFVAGNHEYLFGGYPSLKSVLNKYNVNILDNDYVKLDNKINIYGVKDPVFEIPREEGRTLRKHIDEFNIKDKEFNILLSHRPEHFFLYSEYNLDLVFSGHAHGGQFILPLIGPLFAPHQGLFPKYARGMLERNNTRLIVSRGLGNSKYNSIRINNRPELVIVSLLNK